MPFIICGFVDDNLRAQEVVSALDSMGLSRDHVHLVPADGSEPEHGADPVSTWSGAWGAFGAIGGGAVGWLMLSWTPVPWIGALWGAVVCGICGARFGGYAAYDAKAVDGAPAGVTEIQTEADTRDGAAAIERIYIDHGARGVRLVHT